MPYRNVRGADLYYEDTGAGEQSVVFIHGLMLASESFAAQRDALRGGYRVITFDLRGQGRSEKTHEGLDLEALTEDAAALLDALGCTPSHVVGFSMGAFVALRLAARYPERVRSLFLIGVSADAEDPARMPRYRAMIRFVRLFGPRWIAGRLMRILFGATFLADPSRRAEREHWHRVVRSLPRSLARAAAASAHRRSVAAEIETIGVPTYVVSGEEDLPVPPEQARAVHAAIRGSTLHTFPGTGHAVMLEQPAALNAALAAFLRGPAVSSGAGS